MAGLMEREIAADMAAAREFQHLERRSRFGKSGRLERSVSVKAVMAAVESEGREVLSAEAEGWWKDQDRRHPHIRRDQDGGGSPRAMRNRFGRVKERIWFDGEQKKCVVLGS